MILDLQRILNQRAGLLVNVPLAQMLARLRTVWLVRFLKPLRIILLDSVEFEKVKSKQQYTINT
jgi:hypothetical protein